MSKKVVRLFSYRDGYPMWHYHIDHDVKASLGSYEYVPIKKPNTLTVSTINSSTISFASDTIYSTKGVRLHHPTYDIWIELEE